MIYNKLDQLVALEASEIPAPKVILREGLSSLRVKDIKDEWYPFLGRKEKHFKGKDIVWVPNRAKANRRISKIRSRDFIVAYEPKVREFRVHVLGSRWVSISEKVLDGQYIDNPNIRGNLIWAHRYGWKHIVMNPDDSIRADVARIALEAAKALKFDFGAVDVMLSPDNVLKVFEINSAPSLNNRRTAKYVKYFIAEYGKF